MARSHLSHGLIAGGWVACGLSAAGAPGNVAVYSGLLTWWGALVPDIDHHDAKITYQLGILGWALSRIARLFGGHRGWTHTLYGCAVFGVLTSVATFLYPEPVTSHYAWAWGLAMAAGCLAHILGDMMTVQGCDLFWVPGRPFRRWRITSEPIVTMSADEWWLYYSRWRPASYASTAAALVVALWAHT